MPVVAELRNVIVGDDTNWRAAVLRTQESLAALQAQSQQATSGVATSFAGLGSSVTGAATSFQTLANEAQVAGATISNNGNAAAAAIAPLNGAASSAAQSMSALGASAVQAGAGVGELAARKAALVAEASNLNAAIRSETSVLAGAQSAVASLGGSHQALNQAIVDSEGKLAGYIARQTVLKAELGNVNTALKATSTAQTATNAVQATAAATTQDLGQKTGILSALFSTHTSQISSQGTAWKGYDNVVQSVIRSMGGIPVIWALAISVGGILLEKLLRLGDAKKEQIRLDQEMIASDIQVWQAMNTGTLFTKEYATVLHDVNAINAQVKTTTEALLAARAAEADAIAKSSTAAKNYAENTNDLQLKIAAYVVSLFSQVQGETEATAARMVASKAMADAVEMEIKAAAASGKTIEQLIAEREASGATRAELGLLASAWGTATAARATYESGRTALSTLKLELAQAAAARGEVLQGANAITTLKTAIAGLPPEQRKLVEQSQLVEKSLRELNKTTDAHGAAARGAAAHVKTLTQALSEQQLFVKQLDDAMKAVADTIRKRLNDIDIGKIMHEKIAPIIEDLKRLDQGLRDTITPGQTAGSMLQQIGETALFGDGSLEKLIGTLRASKAATEEAAQAAFASKVAFGELMHQFELMKDRIPQSWATIVDAIVNGSGKAGEAAIKFGVKVAGALGDVAQVIGNLPGKIGDALRKGTSEFEKWFNTIDGILKLLHRAFNSIPDGLGEALSKVVGIFKKGGNDVYASVKTIDQSMEGLATSVEDASHSIGGSLANIGDTIGKSGGQWSEKMSDQMGKVVQATQQGAAKVLTAVAAMMAGVGMIISGHAQGGLGGAITGALGGFMTGAQIGAFFGPTGALVGGIIGAVGGFIAGIVGGAKSAVQKATEQLQLEQLKANVASTVQQTVNAAIEGMKSALQLFEQLADFTVIPYKNITRFFNQLDFLLQKFVEMSKAFGGGMLDAAKELADKIGPIVGVIGNAVGAFEALGGFTGVAQVSVDSFASAMTRVLQSFIGIKDKFLNAEGFIDSTVNQARKFAEKIGGVITVIKDALDAFAGFQTFKNVLPETLDAFAATLQLAIEKMGAIAEAVDKSMIKTAQRFSDRAVSVVALIKTALDSFAPLATFAAIPSEAMDALFAGISDAVSRMQELAAKLDTEMLTRAVAVAEKSSAIFGAIKSGVDSLTSLADFKAVAPEAFQALLDGFNQAVSILNQMLNAATQFETIAIQIEDKLVSAAKHLKDGAAAMAAGLAAAASATGSAPSGGGSAGIASLSAGPTVTGFGIGAPSAPFAAAGGGSTIVETFHVSVTVQGSMIGTRAELQDVVVGAITQAQRRGRAA